MSILIWCFHEVIHFFFFSIGDIVSEITSLENTGICDLCIYRKTSLKEQAVPFVRVYVHT